MTSGNNSEVVKKLLDYYNLENLPTLVGLSSDTETNSFHKYKYEYSIINDENLDKWILDLISSKYFIDI